jgi:alpha-glucosidase
VPPEHAAAAVDVQELDQESVLHHYRETLAFRKAHPPLFDGDLTFVDTHNHDLLAFVREKDGERLLFVFNLTREAQEFALPATMRACLPIPMPGFEPAVDGGAVKLAGLDAFCARV